MLYLEDYLENLEHLPQEIKNGLKTMKELDLHVEDYMEHTKRTVDKLCSKAGNMNIDEFQTKFIEMMNYSEVSIKQSDKKIQLANNMQELLTKYMKRLDDELYKFKMDLEVGNSGITGQIEKRVFDLENAINITNQKSNKYRLKKRSRKFRGK